MAFDVKWWGKVSSSANMSALSVWTYNGTATGANQAVAAIAASGYFNEYQQDLSGATGPLQVGDVIIIHGNDSTTLRSVATITPNVTVAALT